MGTSDRITTSHSGRRQEIGGGECPFQYDEVREGEGKIGGVTSPSPKLEVCALFRLARALFARSIEGCIYLGWVPWMFATLGIAIPSKDFSTLSAKNN